MSIYSQSFPGHQPYGASSYTQPPVQSGYPYPYLQPSVSAPPPPPVYHYLDPASFRREFTARLSELQVNSRPVIQSLSMLAQDYSRFAEIVAQCIEEHIRRVSTYLFLDNVQRLGCCNISYRIAIVTLSSRKSCT
jgi:pre-mRNA cleavage complex 2 protein Pcf11